MAAKSIGAVTFDIFAGLPDRPAETVEALERVGRDYARWRKGGRRGGQSELRTAHYYADAAAAAAAEATYKAMRGTAVTVTDALNTSYANCMIVDVKITAKGDCYECGAAKVRLAAIWTVRQGDSSI